ncbi:hypothetical protein DVH24_014135 [Malus domestica]|uniref:Uncharacterized protein n=1 Tax=Malus domestica TaxID=3750 RepID=A0A498JCM5_MALDO|nr:hypothetical protein DVH24_014135 [Malus domestica]
MLAVLDLHGYNKNRFNGRTILHICDQFCRHTLISSRRGKQITNSLAPLHLRNCSFRIVLNQLALSHLVRGTLILKMLLIQA